MKATKEETNYRPSDDARYRCGNCLYSYKENNRHLCRKVQGLIHSEDVCDLWAKIPKKPKDPLD